MRISRISTKIYTGFEIIELDSRSFDIRNWGWAGGIAKAADVVEYNKLDFLSKLRVLLIRSRMTNALSLRIVLLVIS